MTISLTVSPSSSPLSGSLDVTETSVTVGLGSKLSLTATVACTSTYLWLAGHSVSGVTDTASVGAISSHTFRPMMTGSWSEER